MTAEPSQANEKPELLTVAEVGKRLRRSTFAVRQLIREGVLPAGRPHPRGHWLIPAEAVDRLLAEMFPGRG